MVAPSVERAVAEHARIAPGRPALVDGTRALTYEQLDAHVDRLASALAAHGVRPGQLVGAYVRRSADAVALLLAINRAGGAFLPLDPDYPVERLDHMLVDSAVSLVVVDAQTAASEVALPDHVALDELVAAPLPPGRFPAPPIVPAAVAYVIYTSGSTGRSKGVMVGHAAMAHFAHTAPHAYGLRAEDRVLQFFPLSFDGAIEEISATLARGATLVLKQDAMAASFHDFEASIDVAKITILHLPPAFWHAWCDYRAGGRSRPLPRLRKVLLGGERLRERALRAWAADAGLDAAVVNVYGATEAAMFTTLQVLEPDDDAFDQRVGGPMPGMAVHLLDERLVPVAPGAVGEAYIAGSGVGIGYRARPGITAAAFVPDPFAADGTRMYRTGDLLRRESDGRFVFVGRTDWQVKVRGFRVDPEEVAGTLSEHDAIADAVVLARETATGATELIAFATRHPGADVTADDVRSFAARRLPGFMVPADVVLLDHLPVSAGGKIDRAALMATAPRAVAPDKDRTGVARLWAEALGGDPGPEGATFVQSGGTSLQALWLAARIERAYDAEISAVDLLGWTVSELSTKLRHASFASPPLRIEPVGEALSYDEARSLSDAELRRRFEQLYGLPGDD